mgnify:CR=1 FL=1|jgi:hypothetical protein
MSVELQELCAVNIGTKGEAEAASPRFSDLLRRRRRLMRRDRSLFAELRSKLRVRNVAASLDLPIPELYWTGRPVLRNELPRYVVVKPDRGSFSHGVYLLEGDFDHMSKQHVSPEELEAATDRRRTLAEEFLPRRDGTYGVHTDYKVFVFGGVIPGVQVLDRRRRKICWYTEEWVPMPPLHHSGPRWSMPDHSYFTRPDSWDGILDMARIMGRQVGSFVRVDCYESRSGPVFGETSLTPNGIRGLFRDTDRQLGRLWQEVLGEAV